MRVIAISQLFYNATSRNGKTGLNGSWIANTWRTGAAWWLLYYQCTWAKHEMNSSRNDLQTRNDYYLDHCTIACIQTYHNIARTLVLTHSYWDIMKEIPLYTCTWSVQFQFNCKVSLEFCACSFFKIYDSNTNNFYVANVIMSQAKIIKK